MATRLMFTLTSKMNTKALERAAARNAMRVLRNQLRVPLRMANVV